MAAPSSASAVPARNRRSSPRKRLRSVSIGCLLSGLAAILTLCLIPKSWLLQAAAHLWIVDDSPAAADIIVIPGGQIATRPPKAVELFQAGLAPRIFVMREAENTLLHRDTPGAERAEFVSTILTSGGVPETAIVFSEERVNSTWEEAEQFAEWMRALEPKDRPKSVLLVTDAFHSRRARWAFRKQTAEFGPVFQVVTVPHRKYEIGRWWANQYGKSDFLSEMKKYWYYRFFL